MASKRDEYAEQAATSARLAAVPTDGPPTPQHISSQALRSLFETSLRGTSFRRRDNVEARSGGGAWGRAPHMYCCQRRGYTRRHTWRVLTRALRRTSRSSSTPSSSKGGRSTSSATGVASPRFARRLGAGLSSRRADATIEAHATPHTPARRARRCTPKPTLAKERRRDSSWAVRAAGEGAKLSRAPLGLSPGSAAAIAAASGHTEVVARGRVLVRRSRGREKPGRGPCLPGRPHGGRRGGRRPSSKQLATKDDSSRGGAAKRTVEQGWLSFSTPCPP